MSKFETYWPNIKLIISVSGLYSNWEREQQPKITASLEKISATFLHRKISGGLTLFGTDMTRKSQWERFLKISGLSLVPEFENTAYFSCFKGAHFHGKLSYLDHRQNYH